MSSVVKQEDQILNDSRRNTGALGIATELLGGGVAGGGLANAGLTTGQLLSICSWVSRTYVNLGTWCCRWFQRKKTDFQTVSTRQEKVR